MTVTSNEVSSPAIIRGDLKDEDLCYWLSRVEGAMRAIPSLMEKIEGAKRDIATYEEAISRHKAFISAALYPTNHSPNPPSLKEDISESSKA